MKFLAYLRDGYPALGGIPGTRVSDPEKARCRVPHATDRSAGATVAPGRAWFNEMSPATSVPRLGALDERLWTTAPGTVYLRF